MPSVPRVLVVPALVLLLVDPPAVFADITFVRVVDQSTPAPGTDGNFGAFNAPSLRGGYIGFGADGPGSHSGIYTTFGGLHAVADENTPIPGGVGNFLSFSGYSSFDGSNSVFVAFGSSEQVGVYGDAGSLHAIANLGTAIPEGTGNFTNFYHPLIATGNVAFLGYGSSNQSGVYTTVGGGLNVVADKTTPIPNGMGTFTNFHDPSFAFDGQAAVFHAIGPNSQNGIYSGSGGELHVIADRQTFIPGGTGRFGSFGSTSADEGQVAFVGYSPALDQRGVYLSDGGLSVVANRSTLIPGGTQHFFGFGQVSLDGGNVAFGGGSLDLTEGGLYAFYEGELFKVLDVNDLLDGKPFEQFRMSTEALEGNQIAFVADFTDGSSAIYIATIPEAATLTLVLAGALAAVRRRR